MSVAPSWRAVREDSRQGFGTTKHPETHPLEWCWSVDAGIHRILCTAPLPRTLVKEMRSIIIIIKL